MGTWNMGYMMVVALPALRGAIQVHIYMSLHTKFFLDEYVFTSNLFIIIFY